MDDKACDRLSAGDRIGTTRLKHHLSPNDHFALTRLAVPACTHREPDLYCHLA